MWDICLCCSFTPRNSGHKMIFMKHIIAQQFQLRLLVIIYGDEDYSFV